MLKVFRFFSFLCCISLFSHYLFAEEMGTLQPKVILKNMQEAERSLNYEISFISTLTKNMNAFRYRHIKHKGIHYSQLITLDESVQEIIQRDNIISYFQPNHQAFSITGNRIVDNFPSILLSNIDSLEENYDFIDFGRNRVADRIVRVIRILPKDNFRYQYLVFIDEKNNLLLRGDILDRSGDLLEQFKVVNFYSNIDLNPLVHDLEHLTFPPLLVEKEKNTQDLFFNWQPSWIPSGFNLVNKSIVVDDNDNDNRIETLLYSDGLFSFNLYVSKRLIPSESERVLQQGELTIYTENINNSDVTFVGQLPISTARRIIKDIKFN